MNRVYAFALAVLLLALGYTGLADAAPKCNQWQCYVDSVLEWCGDNGACLIAHGVVI